MTNAPADETQHILYEARDVPMPPGASVELRRHLAGGAPIIDPPYPATNEAWTHVMGAPAMRREFVRAFARELSLTYAPAVIAGVNCFEIKPVHLDPERADSLLINIHAGGYVLDAGEEGIVEALAMAGAARMRVLAIDYRMPPEDPYPAAIDDCVAVWRAMSAKYNPRRMGVFGSSAGGALVLALVQRALIENLPAPGAIVAGTPWADLSETGDSYFINAFGRARYAGVLAHMAAVYAGDIDLMDPRLSPIYGSFAGFPPSLVITGTRDLFMSNSARVDQAIRAAGGESRLSLHEGLAHASYLDPTMPESRIVFSEMAAFLRSHLSA